MTELGRQIVIAGTFNAQILEGFGAEVSAGFGRGLVGFLVQRVRQPLQDLGALFVVLQQGLGELGQLGNVLDSGTVQEVVHAQLGQLQRLGKLFFRHANFIISSALSLLAIKVQLSPRQFLPMVHDLFQIL